VGHDVDARSAFEATYDDLHARIQRFLSLRWEHMQDRVLLEALVSLGEGWRVTANEQDDR
jgi:hypothetical protein